VRVDACVTALAVHTAIAIGPNRAAAYFVVADQTREIDAA
jgi:hypothetical protein